MTGDAQPNTIAHRRSSLRAQAKQSPIGDRHCEQSQAIARMSDLGLTHSAKETRFLRETGFLGDILRSSLRAKRSNRQVCDNTGMGDRHCERKPSNRRGCNNTRMGDRC